ncbi:MAG: ABC transporter permease [Acidimicrobiia bacterium]
MTGRGATGTGNSFWLARYAAVRLALTAPMLLVLLSATFLMLRVAPGDPASATLGDRASPARLEQLRRTLGLDQPLWRQYVDYLGGVATGDLGRSATSGRPVRETIAERFPATLELTLAAMAVAGAAGAPLGALAARRRGRATDTTVRLAGTMLYAAPVFWLGLLLQQLLAVRFHLLPSGGRADPFGEPSRVTGLHTIDAVITGDWTALGSALSHLALPALTLGLVVGGVIVRLVRANLVPSLGAPYVEAARARGIPERQVVYRHALRNALVPVVALFGLQLALLLSGAVLTERTFTWPGIGLSLYHFLQDRDYAGVEGIVTFYAVAVALVSLVIDVVSAVVDPRIRYR